MNAPEAEVEDDPRGTPPISDSADQPGEIKDEVAPEAEGGEQPTFVLPEQSTVTLETPTLKRRAIRATTPPAPPARRPALAATTPTQPTPQEGSTMDAAMRVARQAERYLAARPWLWVIALLICVCILAFLSRQIGG